jgi:hypothetical protein
LANTFGNPCADAFFLVVDEVGHAWIMPQEALGTSL